MALPIVATGMTKRMNSNMPTSRNSHCGLRSFQNRKAHAKAMSVKVADTAQFDPIASNSF